jgi:hypothetical protein
MVTSNFCASRIVDSGYDLRIQLGNTAHDTTEVHAQVGQGKGGVENF